jgi:hypothetical protein
MEQDSELPDGLELVSVSITVQSVNNRAENAGSFIEGQHHETVTALRRRDDAGTGTGGAKFEKCISDKIEACKRERQGEGKSTDFCDTSQFRTIAWMSCVIKDTLGDMGSTFTIT